MGDYRLALFFQQLYKLLLIDNECVNLLCLKVEESGNTLLFSDQGKRNVELVQILLKEVRNTHPAFNSPNSVLHVRALK